MAAIHGFRGNLVFASGHTTNVKAWTMTTDTDTEEALAWSGDGFFRAIQGGKRLSGTITCNVDDTTNYSITDMFDAAGTATFQHISGFTIRVTIKTTGSETGADITTGPEEIAFNYVGDGKPEIDPPGTPSVTASA